MTLTSTLQEKNSSRTVSLSATQVYQLVDRFVLLAVVLSSAWILSLPLRSHGSLMGFAQDDFYYYLKAAQNLAAGRGATFDGTTLTNGYHPLYFLLWTCVSFFVHSLRTVFTLLWLLDVASTAVIFLMARRIFCRITADRFLTNAFAIAVLIPCIATICYQMEVTLALPLGFAFLATGFVGSQEYTARRCAMLGLLGALTMLARLDAGILVFLFLVSLVVVTEMRRVLTACNMMSFSLSALPPLCVYFAVNKHYFHEWLPISGSAKQLKHGWLPDVTQLRLSFSHFTLVFLAITVAACVAAFLLRQRLKPQEKTLCIAALLMPLVFYTVEIFASAWKLWGWYLYAVRFALLASCALMLIVLCRPAINGLEPIRKLAALGWFAPLLLSLAVFALMRVHYKVDVAMVSIAKEDTFLKEFAEAHPGRYAMGDRAGMFGYLSPSPLVQTEGLMMDRDYLQHIRREDDLLTTLKQYKIDYYVQYVFDQDAGKRIERNCIKAQEPSIAGDHALRMRSTVCDPIATYLSLDGKVYVFRLPRRL